MRLRLLAVTVLACCLIAGCGFQLRGATNLPFKTLYIGIPDTSPIAVELKRHIRGNGPTQIVARPADAEAILTIVNQTNRSDLLTLSVAGLAIQYSLVYTVEFRVHDGHGHDFIPTTAITVSRILRVNSNAVLAQEQEINQLFTDMQSDAVQQMLRRMEAVQIAK